MSICKNCKEQNDRYRCPTNKIASCSTNRIGLHYSYNDKPSLVWENGTELWHKNSKLHRNNNRPACISRYNNEESPWALGWWKNGKLHRAPGQPAFICVNGSRTWATNGVVYKKILPPPGVSYKRYPLPKIT